MDTIKSLLPTILSFGGSLVSGMMSGPLGMITGGVMILGIIGLAIWASKKWRDFKANQAQKQENQHNANDGANQIEQNQQQAGENQSSINKAEEDLQNAINGKPKP